MTSIVKIYHDEAKPTVPLNRWEPEYIECLDHGFIGLIDFMGDDSRIVNSARVSYGSGTTTKSSDEGLIRYLMRRWHTSPMESVEFQFHVKTPIFIARQWLRHRTACISGDTLLNFDGNDDSLSHYPMTVSDFYKKWHNPQILPSGNRKDTNVTLIDPDLSYTALELSSLLGFSGPDVIREYINYGCGGVKLTANTKKVSALAAGNDIIDWYQNVASSNFKTRYPDICNNIDPTITYDLDKLVEISGINKHAIRRQTRSNGFPLTSAAGSGCNSSIIIIKGKDAIDFFGRPQGYAKIPKQKKLSRMNLRQLNEESFKLAHTNVTDIWETGIKPTYTVTLDSGKTIRMTKDHRCYTDDGWHPLHEIYDFEKNISNHKLCSFSGQGESSGSSFHIPHDDETEEWKYVNNTDNAYEISNQGRVRSHKWNRTIIKKPTISNGYVFYSLQMSDGSQATRSAHSLVIDAFTTHDGEVTRHLDGNRQNNWVANLKKGSHQENSDDMIDHNNSTRLRPSYDEIISVEYYGNEMTYDLSVDGPHHNFSANGIVIHNSANEYSGRYSLMDFEMYVPDHDHTTGQSSNNKQGRVDDPLSSEDYKAVASAINQSVDTSYQTYLYLNGPIKDKDGNVTSIPSIPEELNNRRLIVEEAALEAVRKGRLDSLNSDDGIVTEDQLEEIIQEYFEHADVHVTSNEFDGIARELSRIVLPLTTYTQYYWKIDLHNLFHFLRLRADPHAQYEIRVYADAIIKLIEPIVPMAMRAFNDYRLYGNSLSRMESNLLSLARIGKLDITDDIVVKEYLTEQGCSPREVNDFMEQYNGHIQV